MIHPTFDLERSFKPLSIAGIDEAGCGPWAGPLVAAAVFLDHLQEELLAPVLPLIADSKSLTPARRLEAYGVLLSLPAGVFAYGISEIPSKVIDQLGLGKANRVAMEQAFSSLESSFSVFGTIQKALIDGIRAPSLTCATVLVKKGDQRSFSIAAASILAKVTRDQRMLELHQLYPHYGWDSNKGYGTKGHQEALHKWGLSPHHRLSFRPVNNIAQNQ